MSWLFFVFSGAAAMSCLLVVKLIQSLEPEDTPIETKKQEPSQTSPLITALIPIIVYNLLMAIYTLSNFKELEYNVYDYHNLQGNFSND